MEDTNLVRVSLLSFTSLFPLHLSIFFWSKRGAKAKLEPIINLGFFSSFSHLHSLDHYWLIKGYRITDVPAVRRGDG
jgi:hypothetical protein